MTGMLVSAHAAETPPETAARLRIAVFHDLPSGGAKRTLREQVRGLRSRGHHLTVFEPATADSAFLPLADVADEIRRFPISAPPSRERLLAGRSGPLDLLRWAHHFLRVRTLAAEIAGRIDAEGFDVALVHPSQYTQAPWVLRYLRTPTVYYCHESLRAAYEPDITTPFLRRVIRHTLGPIDRANLRAATTVVTNSEFTARNVRKIYRVHAHVAYPGVNLAQFTPSPESVGEYLLTVGAIHPLKGLEFMIAALAHVPASVRLPLVIVSDRSREAERERLLARARAAGVDVCFRLQASESELSALYAGARLVLYTPCREPFGLVPLEAMASGRPVLAVRDGGIPETTIDGETGFIEEREERTFGNRITALLRDRVATEAVARRAAALVRERWSWEQSCSVLESLCIQTARRAAGGGVVGCQS